MVPKCSNIISYNGIGADKLNEIYSFFKHYKDNEDDKFVEVKGWKDIKDAYLEIEESINRYKEAT